MNAKARTLIEAFAGLPMGSLIVEIGCARFAHEVPSDGYSTFYLGQAAAARGWIVHCVDIDQRAVANAERVTAGLPVRVHWADGEQWLAALVPLIDGLFLDGALDAGQALKQYEAACTTGRPKVVVVDDVQTESRPATGLLEHGKGDLLLDRLAGDGYEVVIHDTEPGYQMAVAKR